MNSSDEILSEALRELAADSPRGAPPEVGVRVKGAFALHHARRRRNRIAFAVGVAACLLISFAWLRVGKLSHVNTIANQAQEAARPSAAVPAPVAHAGGSPAVAVEPKRVPAKAAAKTHQATRSEPPVAMASGDFVALPTFDPAIPLGQSRMVRLDMPGSDLQLIGYPVNEQLLERRVLTDVLVGQDGVPYAVRLVQTQSTR